MAELPDNGLNISRPVALWNREIKAEPRKLLLGIGKMLVEGAMLDFSDAASAALDTLDAAGLRKNPGELAWLLIYRALMTALSELVNNYLDLFRNPPAEKDLEKISVLFEEEVSKAEVMIRLDFFDRPGDLPLLEQLHGPLADWLHGLGATSADAAQIACRLPDYFVFALHETWRKAPQDYVELTNHFESPFTKATEATRSWRLYSQWLKRQVSDRMFAEAFGVDKVYVPLRAYYEERSEVSLSSYYEEPEESDDLEADVYEQRIKKVFNLEEDFFEWLNNFKIEAAVRFISGGPGSGKSTFAKIFASKIAEETDIPCLYIPLHLFNVKENLIIAMESHVRNNRFLSGNPLDAKDGKSRLLIIFDGLDELALQGKAASEVANGFVEEVLRRIHEGNSQGMKRQVVITGRTIAIQSVASKLRENRQVSYVLPYFTENQKNNYEDSKNILSNDQRHNWWRRYGRAIGNNYLAMPKDLDRESFAEITSQPLLNYLVALSYDRKTIKFTDDTTLNQIYEDLISAVYCRQYEEGGRVNTCVGDLKENEFLRVLEEIALAVWHGDGRTATVASIREKCNIGGIQKYLETFQEGAKSGVTRLLTAFYFRQTENRQDGDPTFEFTHKSFGEYLTALRIVRLLRQMQKQRRRQQEDPDDGWSEKEALKKWTACCAITAMDYDLLRFIKNEFRVINRNDLFKLQNTVRDLLTYSINQGLPFPAEFIHRGFKEHLQLARNAEEALLAGHFCIAQMTHQVSRLKLESDSAFGEWISRLRGQRQGPENKLALNSIAFLDLSGYQLDIQDFYKANFEGTNLFRTQFVRTDFTGANFIKTNCFRANFAWANLAGANFQEANLKRANLKRTQLVGANLLGVNIVQADLQEANLAGANLQLADLAGANLKYANLEKADFSGANLQNVNLEYANLNGTKLERANLKGTILENKDS